MAGHWITVNGAHIYIDDKGNASTLTFANKRQKLNIDTVSALMKQRGFSVGRSKFDMATKTTSYLVTDKSGKSRKMTVKEIDKLIRK